MSPILVLFIYVTVGLIYVTLYTFAAFLFSYKIYLVSNEKYVTGSFVSATGLFINFSLYAFVPYIAISLNFWILGILLLVALAIGAFFANAILSKIDLFHGKSEGECD